MRFQLSFRQALEETSRDFGEFQRDQEVRKESSERTHWDLTGDEQVDLKRLFTGIVSGPPLALFKKWQAQSGVDKETFLHYFQGAATAYGILIGLIWMLPSATELKALRRRKGGLNPPQSDQYVGSLLASRIEIQQDSSRARDHLPPPHPRSVR